MDASYTGIADYLVIEVGAIAGRTIVVVQVRAGEPRTGQRLHPEGSTERWEVRGIARAPTKAVEMGRWGLLLSPVEHQGQLRVDTRLLAA